MQASEHTEAIERDGTALAAAARTAGLDAAVPSCPGWNVRQLLTHLGFVHRWATRYVLEAPSEMFEETDEATVLAGAPDDDEIFGWFAAGHAGLVQALASAPPDLACWTFLPAPSPLAFWARRQAHETAVHRVDAEQAAGGPVSGFAPLFAADGVEELFLFARRNHARRDRRVGEQLISLRATDLDRRWQVPVPAAPGDEAEEPLEIAGRAEDLYLMLWNRLPLEALAATGPPRHFERWTSSVRIRWS